MPLKTNTSKMSTTEKAQALPNCSSVMHSNILAVSSDQLTETRKIVALIAVIEWMKRYFIPAISAGMTSGSVMFLKVPIDEAPRLSEAYSSEGSIWCSEAMTKRIPAES